MALSTIKNLRIVPRDSSFLGRRLGSNGEIFFDQDTKTLRLYTGKDAGGIELSKADLSNVSNSDFLAKATDAGVGSGGSGGNTTVTVGNALPESPENGNLWLNTDNGVLYVYINDGNTLQWIQPSVPISGLENYVTNDRLGNIDFNNNIITSGDSSAISFDVPVNAPGITVNNIILENSTIRTDDASALDIGVPLQISTLTSLDSSQIRITSPVLIDQPTTISGITITGNQISTDDSSAIRIKTPAILQSDTTVDGNLTVNGTISGTISGLDAASVGLGNVTNESKATMFSGPTFTGTTTVSTLSVSGTTTVSTLSVSGTTTLGQTVEKMSTATGITSTTNFNFEQGTVWFLYDITTDFTANFINVPLDAESTITFALIINQQINPYLPTAVQINGASQPILWQDGSQPLPNAEATDVFSFTLIYTGSTWEVLGSLATYS